MQIPRSIHPLSSYPQQQIRSPGALLTRRKTDRLPLFLSPWKDTVEVTLAGNFWSEKAEGEEV